MWAIVHMQRPGCGNNINIVSILVVIFGLSHQIAYGIYTLYNHAWWKMMTTHTIYNTGWYPNVNTLQFYDLYMMIALMWMVVHSIHDSLKCNDIHDVLMCNELMIKGRSLLNVA